ncbi:ras guanine nucleotide exchange factor domain-containing protein [Phycomyces nitens]|nr:ras guanine nucleotide exchange factor domain-containing protein [Phycomyces nitens]
MTLSEPLPLPNPMKPATTSFSPPSLPSSPNETTSPSPLTSHFVQALHDFLPSSGPADQSVSCLFFRKGSIIEVFNRDSSGWWDGLLNDVRGWFPSNYVGRIGDVVREPADFEDERSQGELDAWRETIKTDQDPNPDTVRHTFDSQGTETDQGSQPLPTRKRSQSSLTLPMQDRVELARALLSEDRRRSGTVSSTVSSSTVQEDGLAALDASQWEALMEDVSMRMSELVDACNAPAGIQVAVFQVVSSIRAVLTAANTVNKDSPLLRMSPELARQRKIVLNALSRLVLKGKELQAAPPKAVDGEMPSLANQLLIEMDMFEEVFRSLSGHQIPATTLSPRTSLTSLSSTSTLSLRQQLNSSRLSSASLIAKAVPLPDASHIHENILEHRVEITTLIASLFLTIERYLATRQRATEMLEMTRKAVEAVRTFLAIVEHICSNVGELDYKHSSAPEDPHLVALVIAKEAVYSAITHLVTAVRALTGPHEDDEPLERLRSNCDNVVRTTNTCAACVRTCLHIDSVELVSQEEQEAMRDQLENITDTRRHQTLSVLGRKVTSLNVLQQQYDEENRQEVEVDELDGDSESNQTGGFETIELETIELDSEDEIDNHNEDQENIPKGDSDTTEPATSTESLVRTSTLTRRSTTKSKLGRSDTIRRASAASRQSGTVHENSLPAGGFSSLLRQTALSSVDSLHQISMVAEQIGQNTEEQITVHPLLVSKPEGEKRKSSLARAASVSVLRPQPSVSTTATIPIPPIPQSHPPDFKLSSSKSTPMSDPSFKGRRPRGMSVSNLRMSIKHRNEDASSVSTVSNLTPDSSSGVRRTSSWMSFSSNRTRESCTDVDTEGSIKKEDEPWFIKQRVFSEDEWMVNIEGQVTGANLETLVENLTLHKKAPDVLFLRAFFYNFRLFTDPVELVQLFIKRFHLSPPSDPPLDENELKLWSTSVRLPVQLRVCNVIKIWLESYFSHDFDKYIKNIVSEFIDKDIKIAHPSSAKRLRELANRTFASTVLPADSRKYSYTSESRAALQKSASGSHISLSSGSSLFSGLTLFDDHSEVPSFNSQLPPSVITRSLRNVLRKTPSENLMQSVHVNDFDPLELARQLTLLENSLFCQIRPNEMIGQEFKKKGGVSTAANVKAMIQKSTQVTSWISDSILREADPKKRSNVIKFWIKVGDFCLQLSNYNTLMAIRSALASTSISRLKKTWECVSGKYKAMYEQIYRATDSQRNFAEYRQRLTASIAPCLPFLGVYLTDMTFIDDGNSNHRTSPNGTQLINFDKYIKTTRVLSAIDQFQIPYRLALVNEIQRYLKHCLESVQVDDQAYYSRSLQIEPREEEMDIRSVISVLAGTDR